ncbi:MAG TPA: glycosyltransferase family 4 protein [Candidatus Sumerlaeota bacterium]|nr:glycosyltransferase family 4 protein [Candidatus Sumerlaeota bacterium]
MRLLLLTDDYLPHQGGSRVYYHHLLESLDGAEAHVLTRHRAGDAELDRTFPYRVWRCDLEEEPRLRPLRLQFLPVYLSLLWHGWRVARQVRPDLLVAGELVPTGPVAVLLGWLLRCPLVVFTHAEGPSTLARTRYQSRLARWVCRRAQWVIAASENARQGLRDLLAVPDWKIQILLPAVGEEHFDERYRATPFPETPDATPSPARPIRLLSVGRLIQRKNHAGLLRALPEVLRQAPHLTCTIAGEGPEQENLLRLRAELRLEAVVEFIGPVSGEALLERYAQSDCFVLANIDDPETGDTEGFGIVFAEASAHGLPVIGGNAGGTAESILEGRTGLRVNGRDPEALATALVQVLTNPNRARSLGQTGRDHARQHFRWSHRAQAFRERLQTVVEEYRG